MSERPCPQRSQTKDQEAEKNQGEKILKPPNTAPVCVEIWHPGFDPRFPNQNQTRRCWVNYVDNIRCEEKFGSDHESCKYFKKTCQYMCPQFWIDEWDDQRDNGVFPMPKWA